MYVVKKMHKYMIERITFSSNQNKIIPYGKNALKIKNDY